MAVLAIEAQTCIASFQQCLHQAALIHAREHSLVEDQLARFSVWTGTMCVFEPGRKSLDHRLRKAHEVQDTCAALLDAISCRIKICMYCLEYPSMASLSGCFANFTVVKGTSSMESLHPQRDGETLADIDEAFQQAICRIADQISLLYKLSNTIRRASKDLHDTETTTSKAFRMCDEDGNNVEDFVRGIFGHYIRDGFPAASEEIQQRLTDSMVLRRKRILYRRSRYGTVPIPVQNVPSQPEAQLPTAKPASKPPDTVKPQNMREPMLHSPNAIGGSAIARSATTLAPDKFRKASVPSVVSRTKTIALNSHENLVFPPAPIGVIRKKQKQLRENGRGKENLSTLTQDLELAISAVVEVMCPFCFYAIPASDVADQKKWSSHVLKDLDGYVCLFEECESSMKLYSHSSQWLKHMREHITRWRCVSKSHEEFLGNTREEYIQHMRTAHRTSLTDAQLHLLADKSARPMGPLFESCPLCGSHENPDTIEAHVAGHLRSLALKSLPAYEDEEDDSLEHGSTGSLGPENRSTIQDFMETSQSAHSTAKGTSSARSSIAEGQSSNQGPIDETHERRVSSSHPELDKIPDISEKVSKTGTDSIFSNDSNRSGGINPTSNDVLAGDALFVDQLGESFQEQGTHEVETPLQQMLQQREKFGHSHPDTLNSMANLASTYGNQGRWEEAEKLFMEVMETSKEKLGPDHPDTLTSIANLASTYGNQGRWEEAEKLEVEVMETSKEKLGPDSPDTLSSIANLASTYHHQGRWKEAEKLQVEVMERRKMVLGLGHPDTLTSMANLASTYGNQGRWEETEKLLVEVMETSKEKLGPDHPDTLTSIANLASTYGKQGRWEEAEKLEVEVMERRKMVLGLGHPDTLTSMANLAHTWMSQGHSTKALGLMDECAQARNRALGAEHPDTQLSFDTLHDWRAA